MKAIKIFMIITLCIVGMASCSNDDGTSIDTTPTTIKMEFNAPESYADASLSDLSITLTNINSHKETTFQIAECDGMIATLDNVPGGFYRVNVAGKLNYKNADLVKKSVDFMSYNDGIILTKDASTTSLNMQITSQPTPDPADIAYKGFVLAEIFCAGSRTNQDTYYYADKYFVIYNNTDHILYADSLVIAESDFLTDMKQNYQPDIMSTDMAVKAMYMIPGKGHDVPVQPGGKLLIVDNAVNHTVANPNSWDLTVADYEWYDESTNPNYTDINNYNVPDLDKIYSNSLTMYSPNTRGCTAFALARMHTDKNTFLVDYIYDYAYHLVGQTGEADMTGSCYRLPNSWIIDAVNLSPKAGFQWLVTSPALDRGYTYCSGFSFDDSRLGLSVRRKVASMEGSRAVLQDTNNSTDDFEPRVKADPFHTFGK